MESGIRLDIQGGINTITSADQIPQGGGYPFLQNVRRNLASRAVARFPLGSNLLPAPITATGGLNSIALLNDPYNASAYVSGANGGLYVGDTEVASGLSGKPLSFLPYTPPSSPQPWEYVADPSLNVSILNPSYAGYGGPVCGMLKVRSDGTCYKTGVMEPQSAPVVAVGTGTGANWVTYRYVYRDADTGALSNPSPESAPQLQPQDTVIGSQLAGTGSSVNPNATIAPGYEYNDFNGTPQIRTIEPVSPGTLTNYVTIKNFGLAVPSGVNVDGVQVAINWNGEQNGTGSLANVALFYQGVIFGETKSPGTVNSQTAESVSQGGGSDTWGALLTPEIVNDSTFGFGVQILIGSGPNVRSFIYSFAITVYYTTVQNTGTCISSTDPQVNTIDIYRQTPGLDNFTYVLSVPNSSPSFTDTLSDLTIATNPILSYSNYEPFPSIDLPRSGICTVGAVNQQVSNISIATPGTGQTDGTYNIPSSGGGGTGAVVRVIILGGIITTATLTANGSGYTSAPSFVVAEGGTPGTLVASISPVLPLNANVTYLSGDAFNPRWLPGTIISIQQPGSNASVAYLLYNRPGAGTGTPTTLTAYQITTSGTGFISFGFPPAGTNLRWSIAAPDLAAQPSPVIWGPTPDNAGAFYFGLDPLNPGDLVWSVGNNFDSASDSNRLFICSANETLMNGTITSQLATVFSTERFWLIYSNFSDAVAAVSGTLGQQWVPVQSDSKRGLFCRYALAALGSLIAFRAKDGIFISQGGGPEEDISGNIYNLFPHGEPEAPAPVVIGNQTIYPPDDTKPNAQTIAMVPGYIFYDYQDTTGAPSTLVYDMEAKGWIVDAYTPTVNCHALPVGANQILAGCSDGTIRAFDSAGTETGSAIIITRSENKGSTRIVKRVGGVFLRAVAASAVTLSFWANRLQTAITGYTPATAGPATGEDDYLIDFTAAANADVKDLACEFTWPLGSGNILSEWQPDWTFLPAAVIGWKTGLLSYGAQGWMHIPWINLAYQSTAQVNIVLQLAGDQNDTLASITLAFPSTAGLQTKQFMQLPPNKFKIVGWTANSAESFTIYAEDCDAMLSVWGGKDGIIHPFEQGFGVGTATT